jgi:hypothetical protein
MNIVICDRWIDEVKGWRCVREQGHASACAVLRPSLIDDRRTVEFAALRRPMRGNLRRFAALGLATHGPLCDEATGAPNGSSWWLTETGAALRDELESANGR